MLILEITANSCRSWVWSSILIRQVTGPELIPVLEWILNLNRFCNIPIAKTSTLTYPHERTDGGHVPVQALKQYLVQSSIWFRYSGMYNLTISAARRKQTYALILKNAIDSELTAGY